MVLCALIASKGELDWSMRLLVFTLVSILVLNLIFTLISPFTTAFSLTLVFTLITTLALYLAFALPSAIGQGLSVPQYLLCKASVESLRLKRIVRDKITYILEAS